MSDKTKPKSEPEPRIHVHSVQPGSDAFGNLVLSVMTLVDVKETRFETTEYTLDWRAASMLYANLHSQMASMNEDRVRHTAAGDCKTCGNHRLVKTEKHGRPWNERCPDCGSRWANAEPSYPKASS